MSDLQPNYIEADEFLRQWQPEGPWHLVAISPERNGIEVGTFSGQEPEVLEFLTKQGTEAKWNIYFVVNPCESLSADPPQLPDMKALAWLHVDLDPRAGEDLEEEQKRILDLLLNPPRPIPPPTCIIFSGGGYQGFWRLDKPLPLDGTAEMYEQAKLYNKQLEIVLGGDNCHNVNRLMRLPGPINRLDAGKRKRGRREAQAKVVEWNDTTYSLDQFTKAPADTPSSGSAASFEPPADVRRFSSVDDIKELKGSPQARVVIVQGMDPDDPDKFPGSRSEWLFFVCCEMVRAGCTDDDIYSVITDPAFGVSASVLDKGSGTERYAIRQIRRAHEFADDFQTDSKGNPYPNLHNARMAITKLGVTLEFDEFSERSLIDGLSGFGPHLEDAAVTRLWLTIEETFKLAFGKDKFWAIVLDTARRNIRHPVREFLDTLRWDGVPRLDGWLTDYLGVEDSEYTRAVGMLVLVAAVRRVRDPGCKFDEMMTLEGAQGGGKSSALRALAMKSEWFSDDLPLGVKTQQFIEATSGKWIVEAGELRGMRKGDVETLKACLSRQADRARMVWGRLAVERERQFVIIGTTNSEQYLRDHTGNRRFWPVKVGTIDLAGLRRDREQLWAEAVARELAGESIRLDPSLYAAAAREQDARRVEDPFVQRLSDALSGVEGKLRAGDAWEIVGVPPGQRSQEHNARLGDAMRELGWERTKRRFGGRPEWSYVKGNSSDELEVERDDYGQVRGVRPAGTSAAEEACEAGVFGWWPEPECGWLEAYRTYLGER